MFAVGQKVWHRSGQRSGTVVECDGDRVYIAQDNGVELDYPANDLTATAPEGAEARPRGRAEPPAPKPFVYGAVPVRVLTARDITPEHVRVLAAIPVRTVQAVAALFERRPKAGKFSALDTAGKLNAITEITAIPYRTMRQYSDRPGELGLLMGKGLADSREAG
jgi:hypothetical protein